MSVLIEDAKMPKAGKYDVKLVSEGDGNGWAFFYGSLYRAQEIKSDCKKANESFNKRLTKAVKQMLILCTVYDNDVTAMKTGTLESLRAELIRSAIVCVEDYGEALTIKEKERLYAAVEGDGTFSVSNARISIFASDNYVSVNTDEEQNTFEINMLEVEAE